MKRKLVAPFLMLVMLMLCACGAGSAADGDNAAQTQDNDVTQAADDVADADDNVDDEDTPSDVIEAPETQETDNESTENVSLQSIPQLSFETVVATYELTNGDRVDVSYQMAQVSGEAYDTLARAIAQWNTQQEAQLLQYLDEEIEDLELFASLEAEVSYPSEYALSRESEVVRVDAQVISLRMFTYEYWGGVHPSYTYIGVTFDAQTGDVLALSDLIDDFDAFRTQANDYILTQLNSAYSSELFYDYEDTVSAMWDDPVWYLDAAGITIVFNIYEIGPYAMGATFITLPYETFGDYIQDSYSALNGSCVMQLEQNTTTSVSVSSDDCAIAVCSDISEGTISISLLVDDATIDIGDFWGQMGRSYLLRMTDGRVFVVLSADYASDDYVTFLYEITQGGAVLRARVEDADIVTVNSDALTLRVSMDVFGSYDGVMDYAIDDSGIPVPTDEVFSIASDLYDRNLLTLLMDLPVTLETGDALLPAGTQIRIVGSDNKGTAYFRVEGSGTEGTISYVRGNGDADDYTMYINDVSEYDYYECLPYAG